MQQIKESCLTSWYLVDWFVLLCFKCILKKLFLTFDFSLDIDNQIPHPQFYWESFFALFELFELHVRKMHPPQVYFKEWLFQILH